MKAPKVVIIGGNLAGLSAARRLSGELDVTLVNPGDDCEWLPNIHELVSGTKEPDSLRIPLATVLERCGHRFLRDSVTQLDTEQGRAVLASGRILPFDRCIVAVGGVNNPAGVPGAEARSLPFKSVRDAYAIHTRLCELVDDGERRGVTIVGAGLEGVEVLGEILRGFDRYRSLLDIHVVEAGQRLLPDAPERVDKGIRKASRPFPVKFHTGTRVAEVGPDTVTLDDGHELDSALTIWTGGVMPHPRLREWGLAPSGGDAPVDETLRSRHCERIFVAGDAADTGQDLQKQAYHAMAMGEQAAANVQADLQGQPAEAFEPAPKPQLITFGHLDCFLIFDRMVVAGMVLGQLKEAIYQVNMARLDPPSRPGPALSFYQRLYQGFWHSLWPHVTRIDTLRRLPKLRFYRQDGSGDEREHA